MRTDELIGPALDRAAAQCADLPYPYTIREHIHNCCVVYREKVPTSLSTDWAQAGPIMAREHIEMHYSYANKTWTAFKNTTDSDGVVGGMGLKMTHVEPLVAAMQCWVAHKMGLDIELPAEFG